MPLEYSSPGLSTEQAEQLYEVERHTHNYERWLGAAVTPSGETHVADRIGTTTTAFQIDGGNDAWGSWVQLLGSSDTPVIAGQNKYDLHRLEITAIERTNAVHFVQIGFGASGAAALSANTVTEFVFEPTTIQGNAVPVLIISRRADAGTKAWARCWVVGQNTGTIDFWIGLHEYV